ncbi:MAG: LLM class flavin-dependent oxidoreductase [Actinomycetota bacterium]|nr:LLM class flavin-dependent oxidoreductase [Actinomycetota bacterium]MEC8828068.1 LLM class flavin-dependent oxidoreductase [Actinomycetota bacterium]MEC9269228.1 LLM class flavin-dependent oxidoreductase [Actinomycetota bacterium]MEC9315816.1 LLM class flavin-dependent oxidoreductase [Actinomycetota bacterium]MEC9338668.1 LLM class flavin-dependent oxidoreductase [Actinomycetota bacterium]
MADALAPRRMVLNAFSMNCVSHIQQGMWTREDTRQLEFGSLDPWIELAKVAEEGCFDTIFLADVLGLYDNYKGTADTSLRQAMQVPVNDPMLLIPAMAAATEHLGFAFTSSVLQAHPFTFARQLSTLDHLTNGRVAWNIVTSYLPNAGTNLGFDGLPPHEERYARAEEYLEVIYKLVEGSWADDAVVDDRQRRIYVDPDRVRPIDHHGQYFDVAGPHLSAPSVQRTPVLFQAGMSERGREFAAQHAECVFVVGSSRSGPAIAADLHKRALSHGRAGSDLKLIGGVAPIVGGTEAEALAKREEYERDLSIEAGLAHISGNIGADLGDIDPDEPLETFRTERVQGFVKNLLDSAPAGTRTMGDLVRSNLAGAWLVGSAEQVADELQRRFENGLDGFNLTYTVTPGTFVDFVEGVVPILQQRGLVQTEYSVGSLRRKLFGTDKLPTSHPAATFRF